VMYLQINSLGYSCPLLSQRFSIRSLIDERERGFLVALLPARGVKLEIALITPLSAIKNPRIPMGVICETRPPNNVATPNRTRPAPTMMRLRLGDVGPAESAETRRGSSVKRAASISSSKRFSRSESGTCSQ
jgi:hypothetical protein